MGVGAVFTAIEESCLDVHGVPLRSLVSTAQIPDADKKKATLVCSMDSPWTIVAVSNAWSELCGYGEEEALGQSPKILQGPLTDTEKASRFTKRLLDSGKAATTLVNYAKDGTPFVHKILGRKDGRHLVVNGFEVSDPELHSAFLLAEANRIDSNKSTISPDVNFMTIFMTIIGTASAYLFQTELGGASKGVPLAFVSISTEELFPTGFLPLWLFLVVSAIIVLFSSSRIEPLPFSVLAVVLVGLIAALAEPAELADHVDQATTKVVHERVLLMHETMWIL